MKHCPFCAEKIRDEAVKCRYCGEWLNDRSAKSENQAAPISTDDVTETPTPPIIVENETPSIARPVALAPTATPQKPTVDKPKVSKIILYGALLAIAAVIVDFLFGLFVGLPTTPVDEWFLRALLFGCMSHSAWSQRTFSTNRVVVMPPSRSPSPSCLRFALVRSYSLLTRICATL